MKEEDTATRSPPLAGHVKREIISEVMHTQQRDDSLQDRTGMTPSRHNNFSPWIPFSPGYPVVSEVAVVSYSERRLNSLEWAELLDQTECLEYVSPDVDECIEQQTRMEGNQELDLTGREFVDSPAIPALPPLNTLSSAIPAIITKPDIGPQHNVSRRPGLREQFPRHQSLVERNHVHFPDNYSGAAEQPVEMKRPIRRCSSVAKRCEDNPTLRSTNRSLQFEPPQQLKSHTRRKRASWSGRSARSTSTPSRRQCKSARKSKDCMIPGCTKGARSRGLCKRHGGGKRCTHPGCARSDQGGGFCIAHGGGKRCSSEGCKNSAQSRGLCKSHGEHLTSILLCQVERGAAQKAAPKAAKPEVSAVAIDHKRSSYKSTHHEIFISELRDEVGHQCREYVCRSVVLTS